MIATQANKSETVKDLKDKNRKVRGLEQIKQALREAKLGLFTF
jgi:hypothetical protein